MGKVAKQCPKQLFFLLFCSSFLFFVFLVFFSLSFFLVTFFLKRNEKLIVKKRFAAIKIESVDELETLAAGTKPGTAHHQWPKERERRRERNWKHSPIYL